MTFLYLDSETLSLQIRGDHMWELGWAVDSDPIVSGLVPHTNSDADTQAIAINGYDQRCDNAHPEDISPALEMELRSLFRFQQAQGDPLIVVGANPHFDLYRLSLRWGGEQPWFYRAVDVAAMAMGVLAHDKPHGLFSIAEDLRTHHGYAIPEPDHTAAGDVSVVRQVHLALAEMARQAWGG